MNKILIGVGGVGVLAVLVFIGTKGSSSPSAVSATSQNPTSESAAASAFSLEKVGGGTVALADYKGKKAVILDFWATWCPNCQRDIPHQEAFYQKYKDNVEVIGVNLHEDPSLVAAFVAKYGVTYPVALDPQSQAAQAYNVQYTNYHILINKNGDMVKTVPGDISEADFQSLL